MNAIFFDSSATDDQRRQQLYDGQVFVYPARVSTSDLCEFGREMAEEAFAPFDPRDAQHHMPVERYVAILAELKPRFIHHPRCKSMIQDLLSDFGCDLQQTYFDVPRMRTATHGDYLKSGLAYAFHPHRDTWYSAPGCQINWWLPVYDLAVDSGMALHPHYWDHPLKNSSRDYDYGRWNLESRHQAAQHIAVDTRRQPRAEEAVELDPQLRVVCRSGDLLMFSAAQLHSTVPNTSGRTRISIDFRTVHRGDAALRRGAPNIDSECTGTTMGDYLRATDLAHLPDEMLAMYAERSAVPA